MILRKKKFTVIELIVVIGVIGVLAGITFGIMGYVQKKNRDTKTLATIEMLKLALEQYKEKFGFYPASIPHDRTKFIEFRLDTVGNTTFGDDNQTNFNQFVNYTNLTKDGKKVTSGSKHYYIINDAFGNPIYYRCPGYFNSTTYDIGSLGADAQVGSSEGKPTDNSVNPTKFKTDFGKGDDITNCKR